MSRSRRKGPVVRKRLLKKMENTKQGTSIITYDRDCHIIPKMVGHTFAVHCGNKFVPVYVSIEMVGFRLGEFAETRKPPVHSGDRKSR